jgi:hypothetical protein
MEIDKKVLQFYFILIHFYEECPHNIGLLNFTVKLGFPVKINYARKLNLLGIFKINIQQAVLFRRPFNFA